MNQTVKSRKSRFLRALAAAELSQAAWARQHGITPAHVSLVLNGHRDSETLAGKIDAFSKEQHPAPRAKAG